MVKPEYYRFDKNRLPPAITESKTEFLPYKLERAAHGGWFLCAYVKVEYEMRDGRKVKVEKAVRLRGAQEGQRPNPNPFGRKKKK